MIFIDIGNYSINLDHIVSVYRSPGRERVTIELDVLDGESAGNIALFDDDAIAFKEWWARCRKPHDITIIQL